MERGLSVMGDCQCSYTGFLPFVAVVVVESLRCQRKLTFLKKKTFFIACFLFFNSPF